MSWAILSEARPAINLASLREFNEVVLITNALFHRIFQEILINYEAELSNDMYSRHNKCSMCFIGQLANKPKGG